MTNGPLNVVPFKVGLRVRLGSSKGIFWSRIRGWRNPDVVILNKLGEECSETAFEMGSPLHVHYLLEGILYHFKTEVIEVLGARGEAYLALKVPELIQSQRLRAFPRISVQFSACLVDTRDKIWGGTILEISKGGCKVLIPKGSPAKGDKLRLDGVLPNRVSFLEVNCMVQNHYGGHQFGLQFRQLTRKQQMALDNLEAISSSLQVPVEGRGIRNGLIVDLKDISLPDLLQILAKSRRSYQIEVTKDAPLGQIFVSDGQICNAKTSSQMGKEALFELFLLPDAKCLIKKVTWVPEHNIDAHFDHILLEFAFRLDLKAEGQA